MAYADLGDFNQAVGIQRVVMAAAQQAGLTATVARMAGNLRLYEHQQPCRTPWPADEPVVLSDAQVH